MTITGNFPAQEGPIESFTLLPAQPIGVPIYVPPKIEINDREGRGFLFKRNKWCIDTFPIPEKE
jgi:hypothetical protein